MPRVRNATVRFVCAAVSAVMLVGGVASLVGKRTDVAVGYLVVGALLAAIV
jgi:hypothetical protein